MKPIERYSSFYFVGVAGAGMSAIAQYLAGKGFKVSGSDRQFSAKNSKVEQQLSAAGIQCFLDDGSGVEAGISAMVVSTAIEESHPAFQKAKILGIPVKHRSEILAEIAHSCKTIAVSGTSGKSTVTAMIYHVLDCAGLSPCLITGVGLVSLERLGKIGNAVAGNGEWLVIEADESDGSLVRYFPNIGLILNVDKDHKEISELEEIFRRFVSNTESVGGSIWANGDNALASKFAADRNHLFGKEQSYAVQGVDYRVEGTSSCFRVRHAGELVRFRLPLPGKHNMENALAATAVALEIGLDLREIAEALSSFSGIYRRHQILGNFGGVTLVDDFAHNPAKIAASIRSVQGFTSNRVFAWFQPHGFGPTRFLRHDLVESIRDSLRENDQMFFSEIFYAGGTVIRDISAGDLSLDLEKAGRKSTFIENRIECAKEMVQLVQPGDSILLMGARDPSLADFAKEVAKLLQERFGN